MTDAGAAPAGVPEGGFVASDDGERWRYAGALTFDNAARVVARGESRVASDAWAAHVAVLDRLAANVRVAESHGWTSCAIERVDGATCFSAWGVPPGGVERHPVPDWSTRP